MRSLKLFISPLLFFSYIFFNSNLIVGMERNNNRNIWHIILLASYGYPDAQLQYAQYWLDQGDHQEAHKWLCRYHIRIMQDIACSTNPELFKHLYHSPCSIADQLNVSSKIRRAQFIQQLRVVKSQIEVKFIPDPTWLTKDCKNPHEWNTIRTLIIKNFFDSLS